MMAEPLYHIIKPYECQICHKGNLMFLDKMGRMLHYKYFLDNALSAENLKQALYMVHVKFLQCDTCRRIFLIDWTDSWPKAVINSQILMDFGVCKR